MKKICSKCKIKLNVKEFRKDISKKDGYYPSCTDCYRKKFGIKKRIGIGTINNAGYKQICGKREHRIVMEKFIGRKLRTNEHIHHKNGNKLDNRIENLEIMSASEHHKLHYTDTLRKKILNGINKLRYNKKCIICSKKFVSKCKNAKYCCNKCITKSRVNYAKKYYYENKI